MPGQTMFSRTPLVTFAAMFCVLAMPSQAQVASTPLDAPLRPEVAEQIVRDIDATIRRSFAHWQGLVGFDYDGAFARYRAAALAATTRREFSTLSEAFVAGLNNGHTQFNDPALYAADPGRLGFHMRYIDSSWVVVSSRRPELPSGSVIREIDGAPFDGFYQRVRVQLNASNERTRRSGLTSYAALFPHTFSLTLESGSRVSLDRRVALPAGDPTPPAVSSDWLVTDTLLYVRISSFRDRANEALASDLVRTEAERGTRIILDVRGNGGGNTPSRLGRLLLGDAWRFWRTSPPEGAVPSSPRHRPSSPQYLVLIDRGCGSACEDFAMPFSLSDKAILIGETTGGSSGQPKIVRWDSGMDLWVGARRQWFPDGREFEGVGVAPDIEVRLRAADFVAGSPDRVLRCAQQIALRQPTSGC